VTYRKYRSGPRWLPQSLAMLVLVAVGFVTATTVARAEDPAPATSSSSESETTATEPAFIAEGITIAGVDVGGLTADEAATSLAVSFRRPLPFIFLTRTWSASPSRVGAIPDYDGALAQALAAGPGTQLPLLVRFDHARLLQYVALVDRRYSIAARNSHVRLRGVRPFVTRSRAGYGISARALRRAIVAAVKAHGRTAIEVPYARVRPTVTRRNFGPVIVIRRESKKLVLFNGMRRRTAFGVATGQASYPTPLGRYRIVTKQRHPWWYPPNSDWARGASPIPPGPGNPLGTRWMGLSWGGVGIHGTPDAASIGYSASHGCIRMRIPEAEWLFERVRIGTKVFVVSA
jgi:hypothetical protein